MLIKKSTDSNIFMAEEADKTLICMCKTMSDSRLLPLFLSQKNNKSQVIRSQICRGLTVILLERKTKKNNDIEKQLV